MHDPIRTCSNAVHGTCLKGEVQPQIEQEPSLPQGIQGYFDQRIDTITNPWPGSGVLAFSINTSDTASLVCMFFHRLPIADRLTVSRRERWMCLAQAEARAEARGPPVAADFRVCPCVCAVRVGG